MWLDLLWDACRVSTHARTLGSPSTISKANPCHDDSQYSRLRVRLEKRKFVEMAKFKNPKVAGCQAHRRGIWTQLEHRSYAYRVWRRRCDPLLFIVLSHELENRLYKMTKNSRTREIRVIVSQQKIGQQLAALGDTSIRLMFFISSLQRGSIKSTADSHQLYEPACQSPKADREQQLQVYRDSEHHVEPFLDTNKRFKSQRIMRRETIALRSLHLPRQSDLPDS